MNNRARIVISLLMALWAGAIIGLSFIATPVKFQAPHLTTPVALEVGRYTFGLFSNVELGFLIAIVIAAALAQPRRITVILLTAVAVQLFSTLVAAAGAGCPGFADSGGRSHYVHLVALDLCDVPCL